MELLWSCDLMPGHRVMSVVLQVCLAAVGLVCDLCRALMSNILPYCDEIMQLLLENLGVRSTVHVHEVDGTTSCFCFSPPE